VKLLRRAGRRVGLLRPITLYPFPSAVLESLAERVSSIFVFELNSGQMLEDVRLATGGRCPVDFFGRMGGVLPAPEELAEQLRLAESRPIRAREWGRNTPGAAFDVPVL
jgi:2-oxoglutarate ferredoxin oxidoreductase subunit alpha